jgi:hypothetical protein
MPRTERPDLTQHNVRALPVWARLVTRLMEEVEAARGTTPPPDTGTDGDSADAAAPDEKP